MAITPKIPGDRLVLGMLSVLRDFGYGAVQDRSTQSDGRAARARQEQLAGARNHGRDLGLDLPHLRDHQLGVGDVVDLVGAREHPTERDQRIAAAQA